MTGLTSRHLLLLIICILSSFQKYIIVVDENHVLTSLVNSPLSPQPKYCHTLRAQILLGWPVPKLRSEVILDSLQHTNYCIHILHSYTDVLVFTKISVFVNPFILTLFSRIRPREQLQ